MAIFNEEVYKVPERLRVKEPMAFLSGNDIFGERIDRVPINDMHVLILGAPFGLQGLSQLYDTYGKDNGNAMLAAFTDNIIMRANDPVTVEKISRRSGQRNVTRTKMGNTRGSIDSHTEQTYAILEEVMSNLDVGQAILSIRGNKPFYIELDQ